MRRVRLSDHVVAELGAEVIANRIGAGTALPTEPELCDRFAVSRSVVREAMLRLARVGLVRIRQGAGTVVLDRSHWSEFDPDVLQIRAAHGLIGDLVPDLLQIRRLIEIEVAGCAALSRSDDDLARLAALIDDMAAGEASVTAYNDADIAFHEALIAATGNDLLRQMMRPVNQVRRISSLVSVSRGPDAVAASMAGHGAIFDAVAAKDPDRARQEMALHIARFERDLLAATAEERRRPEEASPKMAAPAVTAAGGAG